MGVHTLHGNTIRFIGRNLLEMSLYRTNPLVRAEIDGYLQDNAATQAGLGSESCDYLKQLSKEWWGHLKDKIEALDPEYFETIKEG